MSTRSGYVKNVILIMGYKMLKKVISGGQTGADRAGLIAAKAAGYITGGYMPSGFLAHDGYRSEFASVYEMREHNSPNYPPRTKANVQTSDGTVRFSTKWNSPGEKLTYKEIMLAGKPYMDINPFDLDITPEELAQWIKDKDIKVLNIAGNSEKTSPGICEKTIEFLSRTFTFYMNL